MMITQSFKILLSAGFMLTESIRILIVDEVIDFAIKIAN